MTKKGQVALQTTLVAAVFTFLIANATVVDAASTRQVFVYNNRNIPASFDPAKYNDIYARNVFAQIFEGLTANNPKDFSIVPGVASRWDISKDGKVYTFYLDKQAIWSNGNRVTAEDFVFSWRRVLDPKRKAPYARHLYRIKNGRAYHKGVIKDPNKLGVRAVNTYTLEVTLEDPTPYFLQLTAFYTLYPLPKAEVLKHGDSWFQPKRVLSNGPFYVDTKSTRLNRGQLVLKRNAKYRQASRIRLQEVRVYAIQDPEKALQMYRDGKLDYTGETDIPPRQTPRWRFTSDFHTVPWFGSNFVRFNTTRPPFNDVRVRKAINLAIDKAKVTHFIVQGGHLPATSFVPEGIPEYNPPKGKDLDVEKARSLLGKSGYCFPGGTTKGCRQFPQVVFLLDNKATNVKLVLGIQQLLKKELGINNIKLDIKQTFKEYQTARRNINYDLARSGWVGDYQDPNTFLELLVSDSANNNTGWANTKYDRLIDLADKEKDTKKRMRYLSRAEAILLDEVPIVPMFHYSKIYLMKPYVRNYFDNFQRVLLLHDVFIEYYNSAS